MSPTSPRQIQIDPHLPSGSRAITIGSPTMSPSRAIAPTLPQLNLPSAHRQSMVGRSFDDEAAREKARKRQMDQDLEIAKSMSRARSESLLPEPSPALVRPSMQHYPSTSPIEEGSFPMLSDAEEAEMDRARSSGFRDHEGAGSEDGDGHGHGYHRGSHQDDEEEAGHDHRSSHHGTSQGSRLLRRHSEGHSHGDAREELHQDSPPDHPGRLHSHHGHGHGVRHPDRIESKSHFDFKAMEEYAVHEREVLGVASPGVTVPPPNGARLRATMSHRDSDDQPVVPSSYDTTMARTNTFSAYGDDADTTQAMSPRESELGGGFARRRQRKLSQSNPVMRRGGKLALFEGFGGGNEDNESALPFKQPRGQKNALPVGDAPNGFQAYSDTPAGGHDKPYRFSFYSNALPVTIHARTLAELPAEGQTFEDLFKGRNAGAGVPHSAADGTEYGSGTATPDTNGFGQPAGAKTSLLTRAANAAMMAKGASPSGQPNGGMGQEEDPEAFTWWLDVQSPTDEEMRMLSKVFGIHPLTTEDILLEETREKIELFRNYYLVCFRSFDQDPYSQTYLEPLNMYIIVFREGTLSFHFRGTPHPQNVRRRIKHLKDYISVTSDWISYALIDDITDAFGPLIQSIEYEVDSIDELVLILKDSEQSDMLRRIGTCRKKVMGLLRLMGNKADVVKGLAKRCNEQWLVAPKSDIGLYLSDIQDHLITMTQNLNHYEKILSRSHSNYLAQISIEMTDANNQINDVLSKLTALGTVLIPMNLVTGLWGMNVHVPGQDIMEGYAWFGGILGCLCAFAVLGAFATYKCFVRT